MVIISIPLSTIPVAAGVAGMAVVAGLRGPAAPFHAAERVSLTMAGAGAGMVAAAAMPAVATGSPGPERLHPIEAVRRQTGVVHPLTGTGEDKC
jgi:hypothetical protein